MGRQDSRPTLTSASPVAPADLAALVMARRGERPRLFRAPGRINIIGEHTDYSGGFAMPAAIDRACLVAATPSARDAIRIESLNMGETVERPLNGVGRAGHWTDYVLGVAAAMAAEGCPPVGCDLVISSDVPIGAGVSSSAALGVAATMALTAMAGVACEPEDIRRIAWTAESRFSGTPCGPLDQFASVFGQRDHALLLDCRALTATGVPAPAGLAFLLVDSGVKHALSDGAYAARRRECEAAADALGVASLRDAGPDALNVLSGVLQGRARHVISENARVHAMAVALRDDERRIAGALMVDSHESLRADFEVTCAETDLLANIANSTPGVHGARQMGGGFGGCILALVDAELAAEAGRRIADVYHAKVDAGGDWFVCAPSDGAGEIVP